MPHLKLGTGPSRFWRLFVIAAGLSVQPALAQQASFVDNFDTLDTSLWKASDGWANGAYQNCEWKSSEVEVIDGMLNVGFSPEATETRDYRCGEVRTQETLGYGTLEARIKTPAGSGLNAAFFTYIGPENQKPHDEIDFEILLKDTGVMQTTTFVSGKSGDGTPGNGNGEHHVLPVKSDAGFIDYAVTWTPEKITFYLNKQPIRTITEAGEIPTTPQRLFFSLWGTEELSDWMGPFKAPTEPIAMQVDWVAYTAEGEECQFPESVLCAEQASLN
ncbi:family 16 glycosylhydrolase [Devosia nitrariae]|uniref:Endo-1,3-1,4-beta-glycanase ExoK n=1 Tax=Devosia nitrariae TaxID=2071872 RepID=A0ABQ5VYX6_9HYPH|nr:family 16 glycosylhydrolase [Devosia nitrariae]GLQ52754.1 endo-1,3-1,4-beta-glycanase ExoK [Devosia nitrariae]